MAVDLQILAKLAALAPALIAINVAMLGVLRALDRLPTIDAATALRLTVTTGPGTIAALALGLLTSALVRTPAQASLALPMLCFPAVLFSGAILPVPVMAPVGHTATQPPQYSHVVSNSGRESAVAIVVSGPRRARVIAETASTSSQ